MSDNQAAQSQPAQSQPAQSQPAQSQPGRGQPESSRLNRRKAREGEVMSDAMEKTVVVEIVERVRHRRYAKTVQRTKRLHVHDEGNQARIGDRVRVAETRPLSKLKRWRVVEILERAR